MKQIYLSGPITSGAYEEANEWRKDFKYRIEFATSDKVKCLSPMRGKHYLKDIKLIEATGNEKLGIMSGGPQVVARSYSDVTNSDIILVNLLGASKVSMGTMFEVAWAFSKHIPIILVIEDDVENVHSHSMLFAMISYRVNNLHDAFEIVRAFFDE